MKFCKTQFNTFRYLKESMKFVTQTSSLSPSKCADFRNMI